jgi:hypothetical protein
MASKDETISKIYHEFYGSINNTYADAKEDRQDDYSEGR